MRVNLFIVNDIKKENINVIINLIFKVIIINIDINDSVQNLKSIVNNEHLKNNIDVRYVYGNKTIYNHQLLKNIGIKDFDQINIKPKLKGGMINNKHDESKEGMIDNKLKYDYRYHYNNTLYS